MLKNEINVIVIANSGAIISDGVAERLGAFLSEASNDSFGGSYLQNGGFDTSRLPAIFMENAMSDRGYEIDAVFLDVNGISHPRLVVRLKYNYFHDWSTLDYNAVNIVPVWVNGKEDRDCPLELVRYFPAYYGDDVAEKREFTQENLNEAIEDFCRFFREFPTK